MRAFLDEDFLLHTASSRRLFHEFAESLPIIDYHCHLPVAEIAQNTRFDNLTRIWLLGDHYKWRAMRTNGVPERYCTGDADDWEKFQQWAATVPYTIRNPLYHWTHLELRRYFDCQPILSPESARGIYEECSAKLRTEGYSVRNLLRLMKVKLLCTTDDPADNLEHHRQLLTEGFEIPVLPAFRPDQALKVDNPEIFNRYLGRLESVSSHSIASFVDFLGVLRQRHDYFGSLGCCVSDHGLEQIPEETCTENELGRIFNRIRKGNTLAEEEVRKFQAGMLFNLAEWDAEKGWVQQYHLGAMRNNNQRMALEAGADSGWDSIGDFTQGKSLARFLNRLDQDRKLAKTILYNVNPADNEVMATMTGNFNDGSGVGRIQWGAAWWFMDQKEGMIRHLNTLSSMGLLSRFVGMITDSRSFLSYPRHEYFRRLLCDLLGTELEAGEIPSDWPWLRQVIEGICYENARNFFPWRIPPPSVDQGRLSKS
jgi:glucuronate isomerase